MPADIDADLVHNGDREGIELARTDADRIDEDAAAIYIINIGLLA